MPSNESAIFGVEPFVHKVLARFCWGFGASKSLADLIMLMPELVSLEGQDPNNAGSWMCVFFFSLTSRPVHVQVDSHTADSSRRSAPKGCDEAMKRGFDMFRSLAGNSPDLFGDLI